MVQTLYLPLLDKRTELVRGEIHTVEVGKAVLALDFVNSQLDLAESTVFILGEITERDFDNATLKVVVGVSLKKKVQVTITPFGRKFLLWYLSTY
jgi:hypothetical protein